MTTHYVKRQKYYVKFNHSCRVIRHTLAWLKQIAQQYKGVSEAALTLTHQHIHIPMFGMGNSLNVSTAGAMSWQSVLIKLEVSFKDQ